MALSHIVMWVLRNVFASNTVVRVNLDCGGYVVIKLFWFNVYRFDPNKKYELGEAINLGLEHHLAGVEWSMDRMTDIGRIRTRSCNGVFQCSNYTVNITEARRL